jgi:outer membrane protein assembly factor BamB
MSGSKVYVGHYESEILCFDLDQGALKWRYRDRSFPYYSSPAIVGNKVLIGGRDRQLHCLEP